MAKKRPPFALGFDPAYMPPEEYVEAYFRVRLFSTEDFEQQSIEKAATLTPRERQVAALMALGMPNRDIAKALDISIKTLDIHRAHVCEKLGVLACGVPLAWLAATRHLRPTAWTGPLLDPEGFLDGVRRPAVQASAAKGK